jgi:hypothetical protein
MTDVQAAFRRSIRFARWLPGSTRERMCMLHFDNWWERLAILARFAPVLVSLFLLAVAFVHPMGYYWEIQS